MSFDDISNEITRLIIGKNKQNSIIPHLRFSMLEVKIGHKK